MRGSPFSSANYSVNLQIFPAEQIEQIQPQAFATAAQNIYVADGEHVKVAAILPSGNKLTVGEQTKIQYQTIQGKPFQVLLAEHPENKLIPDWKVTKGEDRIKIDTQGNVEALQPGEVTIQGTIPGLAAEKGFLFIDALGRVGDNDQDGTIHWVSLELAFMLVKCVLGKIPAVAIRSRIQLTKSPQSSFLGCFCSFPYQLGC